MPYKMNQPQYESVHALSSNERCSHFIGKVADWEQLWGVKNEQDWLVPEIEGDEPVEYFPVWPHPEYAQKITDKRFPGCFATEISLDEFFSDWLPRFSKDNVKVGVFPNKEWVFWAMEPDDLEEALRDEASLYE